MKFEWKDEEAPQFLTDPAKGYAVIYSGSLYVDDKRIALLSLILKGNGNYHFYLNFQQSLLGISQEIKNGLKYTDESFRTKYIMNYILSESFFTHDSFEYGCIAFNWMKTNGGTDKEFFVKEKCKLLFPLLNKEDIPDLIISLDRLLEEVDS